MECNGFVYFCLWLARVYTGDNWAITNGAYLTFVKQSLDNNDDDDDESILLFKMHLKKKQLCHKS